MKTISKTKTIIISSAVLLATASIIASQFTFEKQMMRKEGCIKNPMYCECVIKVSKNYGLYEELKKSAKDKDPYHLNLKLSMMPVKTNLEYLRSMAVCDGISEK